MRLVRVLPASRSHGSSRPSVMSTPPTALLVSVLLAVLLLASGCTRLPTQEMSDARQAVAAARAAGAGAEAPAVLARALERLARAEAELARGNYAESRREALAARAEAMRARDIALGVVAGEGAGPASIE